MLRPWAGRGRAFTLIEIMLVVVILGTLAAMMAPRFAGKQTKALVNTTRAEIANLSMLIDSFRLDAGRYPGRKKGVRYLFRP